MTATFETCCPQCKTYYSVARAHLGSYGHCTQCQNDFLLAENTSLHTFSEREVPTLIPFDSKQIVSGAAMSAARSSATEATPREKTIAPGTVAKDAAAKNAGAWSIGDIILGTYEVRELAPGKAYAEGGLGMVHRVWHREWELDLAVKSPKNHVLASGQGKTSYEQEALHWLHLELHPNIVSCYMVRRIDDIPRLFAEFVVGGSLWDWMADGRLYQGGVEVSRRRVLDMLIQFAWGIQHAHHQNILHLDIKPGNIMIDGSTLKVTDFGLSVRFSTEKNLNAPPAITKLVGLTPHYCSPEQYALYMALSRRQPYEGYHVGIQSDIWSFAVTALAMLKGKTSERLGPEARATLEDLVSNGAPPERPEMSPGLPELLRQCLELDPANRPASMQTIAAQLIEIYQNDFGEKYARTPPTQLTLNVDSLNNHAASLIDLGKPQEAEAVFQEATSIQPWHPLVTYNSMLHSWRNGRLADSDAAALMETLTQMHPQSALAWYAKGLVQRERGDIWMAINALEKSLECAERLEVRRSYEATSPLILSCVKLVRNLTIPHSRFVDIYLAEQKSLLLLCPENNDLQLRGVLDDDADLVFTRHENRVSDSLAMTKDRQWEILQDDAKNALPDTLRINRVGIDKTRRRFRRVIWNTLYSQAADTTQTNAFWETEVFDETKIRLRRRLDDKIVGVLEGDTEPVTAVVISRGGDWVITGSRDGVIRLWETASQRCVRTIPTGNAAVEGIFLSPCESFLLVITRDGRLCTLEIALLTQHFTRCRAPYLISVMTSIESASRIQTEIKETTSALYDAIAENNTLQALEFLTRLQKLPGWEATRRSLEGYDYFYRNAKRSAPQESVCIHSFGCADRVSAVALSREANILIASGRDANLSVWNFNESNVPRSFAGHTDWVRSVVITADAKFAISGSWDGTVRLWNLATGRTVRVMPAPMAMISQIALDHSGRYLIVANDAGDVKVWGMASNTIAAEWFSPLRKVRCLAISRDDKHIAIGGVNERGTEGKVAIYDWHLRHQTHEFSVGTEPVTALALTSDMSHAIVGDAAGKLTTWHIPDRYIRVQRKEHRHPVTSIQMLNDDLWFIASSQDRTISTHHLVEPRHKVLAWHSAGINALALDHTGKHLVSGAEDGIVRVRELYWDFTARREEDELPKHRVLYALITSYKNAHTEISELTDTAYAAMIEEMAYRGFSAITREEIDAVLRNIK